MSGFLSKPIKDYFPSIEHITGGSTSITYISVNISVFDHWLTEAEADLSRIMCYSQAYDAGKLDEYCEGEQRMMSFYRRLSEDGALCNRPRPCRSITADDPDLLGILRASLREERFMDMYFISGRVRVMGGYDRTDTAFLESENDLERLKGYAREAGVFVL